MDTRRTFIERCAQTAFGLTVLPNFAQAGKGTAGFGSAERIIFINVAGGMSHIDTFDPKKGPSKGPGKTIRTKADFQVTNYLENTAKVADQISVIRTMTAKIGVHGPAQYFMRTAFAQRTTVKHPNLGAWAEHYLGKSDETLPASACINDGPRYGNGFFPPAYSPIPVLNPENGLQNIDGKSGTTKDIKRKLGLAQDLSSGFMKRFPDSNVGAYQQFYDHSLRLLRSKDLSAFDISKENQATRDKYGEGKVGQGLLLARRLVEGGIRFVELTAGGWDMHKNLQGEMEDISPPFDKAYAALITDLKQRGLFDSTLVVLATEFGRKPEYNGDGRGHHPVCFSCVLAGAGIKRGFVYGETDSHGAEADKAVSIGDFHATIGHAAGLPIKNPVHSQSGRPFYIGGKFSKPLMELFS